MPRYDFKCVKCGDVEEVSMPASELNKPVHCERCGKVMIRDYSNQRVSDRYKGSGFHKTDYTDKGK